MSARGLAERPTTYADLRRLPVDERWELIAGQAYAMTGPSWQHQAVSGGLVAQLLAHFRARGCRVLHAPLDVRLPDRDEADDEITTVVQPDISVVCDASKLDARGCRGAPELVIEILSPSTAARDQLTKRALYERHGVHEYWTVHPLDRIVTIYRRSGEAFAAGQLSETRGLLEVESFAGLVIDWDQVFADVPAEA